MATTYFTFELDNGEHSGLVRETRGDGYTLERVDRRSGNWVIDNYLMRHFVDPGDSKLTGPISKAEARAIAKRYGVKLPSS